MLLGISKRQCVAVGCHRFVASMAGPLAWVRWRLRSHRRRPRSRSFSRIGGRHSGAGTSPAGSAPLDITAERIDYRQDQAVYEANGSVVIQQGAITLTADHATIQVLSGILTAVGHVHLTDPQADVTAERMEINVNTEAGVATHAQLYAPTTNSSISGRLLQRFSEYHYRVKDGSFTNCDAQNGEVPAWRFRFKRSGSDHGDTWDPRAGGFVSWMCPRFHYPPSRPMTKRQTGFLIPSPVMTLDLDST